MSGQGLTYAAGLDRAQLLHVDRDSLHRHDAVNALGEYQLDEIVGVLNERLGQNHDVRVIEPDFAGGTWLLTVQRALEVDHRRHQPPIVPAAEDDYLMK